MPKRARKSTGNWIRHRTRNNFHNDYEQHPKKKKRTMDKKYFPII